MISTSEKFYIFIQRNSVYMKEKETYINYARNIVYFEFQNW